MSVGFFEIFFRFASNIKSKIFKDRFRYELAAQEEASLKSGHTLIRLRLHDIYPDDIFIDFLNYFGIINRSDLKLSVRRNTIKFWTKSIEKLEKKCRLDDTHQHKAAIEWFGDKILIVKKSVFF